MGISLVRSRLFFAYILAVLGDLDYAILLVGCVLYGTQLGGSTAEIGLIGGAYGLTYLFMPAILGRLGDRIPRKTSLILAATCQIAVALYFLVYAHTVLDLIIGQLLLGVAMGFHWQSIEAFISEATGSSAKLHERGMSLFCISWSIGFMVGPLIAGIFSDYNVRDIFVFVLVTYAVDFCVAVFGIPSRPAGDKTIDNESRAEKTISMEIDNPLPEDNQQQTRVIFALLLGMMIYSITSKLLLTYFANYAKLPADLGGLAWSGTLIGEVQFCFGVGRTIYFLFGGFVKNSIKHIRLAFLGIAALLFALIFSSDPLFIATDMTLFGFLVGLIYLQTLDLLLQREKKAKGAKAGLFESFIGLGTSLAPIVAGWLAEVSLLLPFIVYGALTGAFFVLNVILTRHKSP